MVAPVSLSPAIWLVYLPISKCPHDGACPLRDTPDVCSFPQRFISPDFLKKTKHSKIPYENSYYSYVVIKKGKRPSKPQEFVKAAPPPSIEVAEETLQEDEQVSVGREASNSGLELVYPDQLNEEERARLPNAGDTLSLETERQQVERKYRAEQEDMELQEHIRQSSYHWRRIIYSPMKASGHVTMDACTPTGTSPTGPWSILDSS